MRWIGCGLGLVLLLSGCSQDLSGGRASPTAVAGSSPSAPVNSVIAAPAAASAVLSSDSWDFEGTRGVEMRTPSYRIFTTMNEKSLLVERLPRFMEGALAHYTSGVCPLPRPGGAMESYILANRPQWTRLTQRVMGDQAETYLLIKRGGFAAGGKAILYDIGVHDTLAIAAHEGWHQYTQRVFRQPLPVWLEEGLACYMEGYRWDRTDRTRTNFLPWANEERYDALRRAERSGKLIPLAELTTATPQELMARDESLALSYYAQVWALTQFLMEGEGGAHADALRSMLRDAAAGRLIDEMGRTFGRRAAQASVMRRRGDGVLRAYVGKPGADLDEAYRAFITNICRFGAKQQIVQGLSPVETPAAAAPSSK